MAKKIQPNELLSELAHFTGTTQWFKNPMFPNFRYTDGVKYLAEKAEAYWLLDYIFSNQISPVKEHPFQVWKRSSLKIESTAISRSAKHGRRL